MHGTNILEFFFTINNDSTSRASCYFQGAIIGFISGIGILIWIGVGGILHKPVAPGSHILPYSTDNCPITNSTDVLYSSLDEYSTITDGITVLYTYANTTQGGYTAAAKIIDDDR